MNKTLKRTIIVTLAVLMLAVLTVAAHTAFAADAEIVVPENGHNYNFYYQTRENAADPTKTDYRIVCVANLAWLSQADSTTVTVVFFKRG